MAMERPEMPPLAASAVDDLSAATCDASAHQIPPPDKRAAEEDNDDDDGASCEDFEFTFAARDATALPFVTADEIFSGGWILPVYPVFNREQLPTAPAPTPAEEDVVDRIPFRRLLIEEEAPAEPSWENPPERCRKSASTGSSRLWWRDMVVGRSHSDGNKKFVFLQAAQPARPPSVPQKKNPNRNQPKSTKTAAAAGGRGKDAKKEQIDTVTPRRFHYGRGTKEKAVNGPRRSFLPYRKELLGLFAPVTGLRRTYRPF